LISIVIFIKWRPQDDLISLPEKKTKTSSKTFRKVREISL